jgi:hypothetical protein
MTPEQIISDLNAALASDGETIELWAMAGTAQIPFKVTCRAFVRTLRADELIGNLKQDASRVTISPTEIERTGWPGANSTATPTESDRRVPRNGQKVKIAGKLRTIESARPKYVGDRLVRIDMDVLG